MITGKIKWWNEVGINKKLNLLQAFFAQPLKTCVIWEKCVHGEHYFKVETVPIYVPVTAYHVISHHHAYRPRLTTLAEADRGRDHRGDTGSIGLRRKQDLKKQKLSVAPLG